MPTNPAYVEAPRDTRKANKSRKAALTNSLTDEKPKSKAKRNAKAKSHKNPKPASLTPSY